MCHWYESHRGEDQRGRNYPVQTAMNDIGVTFTIPGGYQLAIGDELEVDLPNVLSTQTVRRLSNGKLIEIQCRDCDVHDLRLPMQHGGSRIPTPARLREGS